MGHQKKKGAMLLVQHVQPLENRLRDTRAFAVYLPRAVLPDFFDVSKNRFQF